MFQMEDCKVLKNKKKITYDVSVSSFEMSRNIIPFYHRTFTDVGPLNQHGAGRDPRPVADEDGLGHRPELGRLHIVTTPDDQHV